MRNNSLLILGRGYTQPARFPRCDVTWTTLACVNGDKSILALPNLLVWDCGHNIPNLYNVQTYDINDDRAKWESIILTTHGRTFANQYCWMLADLAQSTSQFGSVTLFGVNMSLDEYTHEAHYMAYHLGYLRACGVSYTICDPSALLRPVVYGFANVMPG